MRWINKGLAEVERALMQYDYRTNLCWFRRGVYAVLLLKMLFIWPELRTFYQHVTEAQQTPIEFRLSKLMFWPVFKPYVNLWWALACVCVLVAMVYVGRFWLSITVFIISLNYMSLALYATNGGDKLLNFFVLALVFVNERRKTNEIKLMLNNAVALFIKISICGLYFVNGYGKILQKVWRDGSFIGNVWHLDYYANHHLVPNWFGNTVVCFIVAWLVMLFELSFPFFIWFRPFRKWFIPMGLLFHIFIAAFLSLPDFGLTMIFAYLLFVDKNKLWSLKRINKKSDSIQNRFLN
jgi:hypothetical protein